MNFAVSSRPPRGFTLLEIMVSLSVMLLLGVLVTQIVNGVTSAAEQSQRRLASDSQARASLGRLALDLERMNQRPDMDYFFDKAPGNDRLFFVSEVPGYFSNEAPLNQSGFSLAGYRINDDFQLERLGKGLVWSGGDANNRFNYLSFKQEGSTITYQPLAESTLSSRPVVQAGADDPDYHILADSIFRVEIYYLLKRGVFSTKPVAAMDGTANNLSASGAPTSSADTTQGYAAGSRWYDTVSQRAYLCMDASSDAAVWSPLGWRDVRAVVVAIATLDGESRKIADSMQPVADLLPDVAESDFQESMPRLMDQTWTGIVKNGNFANASGLPPKAASAVRIYQRYFYLSSL